MLSVLLLVWRCRAGTMSESITVPRSPSEHEYVVVARFSGLELETVLTAQTLGMYGIVFKGIKQLARDLNVLIK